MPHHATVVDAGLVRSFQNLELLDEMTVEENLHSTIGTNLDASTRRRVVATFGLRAITAQLASSFPYGRRRLLASLERS
jgi:ABC-type branched-subunit amino acid transport system ATPase component